MKKPPLSQASFKSSSRHGCHAIVKCPNDHCGYVGRSDSVKRHIKRKHPDMHLVPPTRPKVSPRQSLLGNVKATVVLYDSDEDREALCAMSQPAGCISLLEHEPDEAFSV
ncbi:MAG: hypothetical protein ACK56F_29890, partial [bacterium]